MGNVDAADVSPKNKAASGPISLGRVKTIRMPDDITFKMLCVHGQLRFTFWSDSVVEIQVIPIDTPTPFDFSWFLQDFEATFPSPPAPKMAEDDFEYILKTPKIAVHVSKKDSAISIYDAAGKLLQRDHPRQPTYWDLEEQIVYAVKEIREGTHFYGFGEKTGDIDKKGLLLEMWNTDDSHYVSTTDPLYQSHPFCLCLSDDACYGLLFLNHGHSYVDVGAREPTTLKFWATNGAMDYIFIAGGVPAEVIDKYTTMVGKTYLPPKWVLGYHQCRWSYMSRDEVLEIAEGFRSRRLPCDAIWLDIDYMEKWQDFTWNRKRFKNPADLLQKLHNQGFKVIAILDPGIRAKGNETFKSGEKIDAFCKDRKEKPFIGTVWPGKCVFPDFAKEEVREWWADLHDAILAPGMLDGTWIDMNEPCHFGSHVAREKSTLDMYHELDGHQLHHEDVHNAYGFLMAQAERAAYDKFRAGERPFILTRAGFSGVQRYAAVWTGDNQCTWEHLKLSVPMLLGMGISGISLCGADIGGFKGTCTPELFARWIQLGILYPFCRNHASKYTPNHEPWVYGDEITAIAKKYLYLRYQFLPYLYDALVYATKTGFPIMRALCLIYPGDPKVHGAGYQFMLGDFLLAAPVLDEGAKVWDLYLPEGEWVNSWTDEIIAGGQSISQAVTIDTLPMYTKRGAIIPLSPIREFVPRGRDDLLHIAIYPGPHTEYRHWEDDGGSKEFLAGKVNEYLLEQELTGTEEYVTITPRTLEYTAEKWTLTFFVHLLASEPKQAYINGQVAGGKWDAKKKLFSVTWVGSRQEHVRLVVTI